MSCLVPPIRSFIGSSPARQTQRTIHFDMSEKRVASKVGFFVVLTALASLTLVVIFLKGYLFTPTYELRLKADSVGGLRKGAAVLLSGVVIGTVIDADVAPVSYTHLTLPTSDLV